MNLFDILIATGISEKEIVTFPDFSFSHVCILNVSEDRKATLDSIRKGFDMSGAFEKNRNMYIISDLPTNELRTNLNLALKSVGGFCSKSEQKPITNIPTDITNKYLN